MPLTTLIYMSTDKIIELLSYTLPAVVTGLVAFYFLERFFKNEERVRKFQLHKEHQKQSFPLRLQAYERMVLFLERINPNKLLIRVQPFSEDKIEYLHLLVQNVEQEFDHNLSQQIYVTEPCWDMIVTAKNTTLQLLRNKAVNESIKNAQELQEVLLREGLQDEHPSEAALAYIRNEVADLF
jgi:hypothetical protein